MIEMKAVGKLFVHFVMTDQGSAACPMIPCYSRGKA